MPLNQPARPKVLDLFSGAGGMSLGFEMAGYKVGAGIELNNEASQTFAHNFGNICYNGDIASIDNPREFLRTYSIDAIDVIVGGPPCQGFSRVGRGKIKGLMEQRGEIKDARNQYYREFIRFVDKVQPHYFVMENVPDMLKYGDENGLLVQNAQFMFEQIGYSCTPYVLLASDYGVPQTRSRLFLIGNRHGFEFIQPVKTHEHSPVTTWDAIGDLPIVSHNHRLNAIDYKPRYRIDEQIGNARQYLQIMREGADEILYNHLTRWHNEDDLEAFSWMQEGSKYIDLPAKYKRYRDDIFKDKYRKLIRNKPSWTIEAHISKDSYRFIYPSRIDEPEPPRTISVREAARLQSFPDRFRFMGAMTHSFRQIGNSVPPLLIKAIAEAIKPQLSEILNEKQFSPME